MYLADWPRLYLYGLAAAIFQRLNDPRLSPSREHSPDSVRSTFG